MHCCGCLDAYMEKQIRLKAEELWKSCLNSDESVDQFRLIWDHGLGYGFVDNVALWEEKTTLRCNCVVIRTGRARMIQ